MVLPHAIMAPHSATKYLRSTRSLSSFVNPASRAITCGQRATFFARHVVISFSRQIRRPRTVSCKRQRSRLRTTKLPVYEIREEYEFSPFSPSSHTGSSHVDRVKKERKRDEGSTRLYSILDPRLRVSTTGTTVKVGPESAETRDVTRKLELEINAIGRFRHTENRREEKRPKHPDRCSLTRYIAISPRPTTRRRTSVHYSDSAWRHCRFFHPYSPDAECHRNRATPSHSAAPYAP